MKYRVTLVDDENCRDWEVCQGEEGSGDWIKIESGEEITIPEDSCHLIEINAI